MKNHLIILLLFPVVSFSSSAQGLVSETGFNETYNIRSVGVVASQDGYFLVRSVSIENSFPTYAVVGYYNEQNVMQWEQALAAGENPVTYEYTNVTALAPSPDGGIYITASYGGCDYIIAMNAILTKIMPDGSKSELKAYKSDLDEESGGGYEGERYFKGLSEFPGGNLKVQYNFNSAISLPVSSLLEIDPSGLVVDSIALTAAEEFIGFGKSDNWNAVGFAANQIFGIDQDGSSTLLRSFSSDIADFVQDENFIYIATADSVFRIEDDSTVLSARALFHEGPVKQLYSEADSLVCIQHSGSSIFLTKTDENLAMTSSQQFGTDLENALHADYNTNRVIVAENYSLTLFKGVRSLLFKRNDPSGINIIRADAKVSNMNLLEQVVTVYPSPNPGTIPDIYSVQMHLAATVKNEGTAPIHSVWLNHMMQQGIACNYNYYRNEFTGLNIQPGDSLELDLGWIIRPSGPSLQSTICVYSSFVNGIADLNVANDQFCKYIVHGTVGLEETAAPEFSVYPNPSNGEVSIVKANSGISEYSIFTTNGKLIKTGSSDFSSPLKAELAPGMYLIRLTDQNGKSQTEKVVIN